MQYVLTFDVNACGCYLFFFFYISVKEIFNNSAICRISMRTRDDILVLKL